MMATVTEAPEIATADAPFPITAAIYEGMVERGEIPEDRRVYLWDGRLFEKMAKTRSHAGVQAAFVNLLVPRLPQGAFLGSENPVRLDDRHLPLPDLIVALGRPLELHRDRYPDGRDVLLVVEVAVTSLPADLGGRLIRYADALPHASCLVADVLGGRLLLHTNPLAGTDEIPGRYGTVETITRGGVLRLTIAGTALAPIPFEELLP
jgi:hypothetical protein